MAVNPTRNPGQVWVDNTPPNKDWIVQLLSELIAAINGLDPQLAGKADLQNSGKVFTSRAAAVSAGQAALPGALGIIFTVEGADNETLAVRSFSNSSDDPLFATQPRWGVAMRVPNALALDAKADIADLADVATSGAKADIGLGNVDNTSDANKPVSTAQQAALDLKARGSTATTRVWRWLVGDNAAGNYPLGLDFLGRLWFRGADVTSLLDERGFARAEAYRIDETRRGIAWALRDALGRSPLFVSIAGRLSYHGRDRHDWLLNGPDDLVAIGDRLTTLEGDTSEDIAGHGDSLTEGAGSTSGQTYPAQLAALLGRTVTNLGAGSQNAAQIASRAGGRAALLTVTGDEIPPSGAVTVTAWSVDPLYYAGTTRSINGTLAGVPGVLQKVTTSGGSSSLVSYTFTRSTAGSAVRCLPDTPFIPTGVYPKRIHVIWIGRNNYSGVTDSTALAAVNAEIRSCIDSIIGTITEPKRYIIMGVTSREDSNEYVGTNNYTAKRNLVAELARDYPANFIDIDAILRTHGDGSGDDNTDIVNGIVPRSLRADGTHLNNAGYAIVADEVAALINQNGW